MPANMQAGVGGHDNMAFVQGTGMGMNVPGNSRSNLPHSVSVADFHRTSDDDRQYSQLFINVLTNVFHHIKTYIIKIVLSIVMYIITAHFEWAILPIQSLFNVALYTRVLEKLERRITRSYVLG